MQTLLLHSALTLTEGGSNIAAANIHQPSPSPPTTSFGSRYF
jgi:hypothetical protein